MAESGLYDIVAHPDLIKIFSVNEFHDWLARPDSMEPGAGTRCARQGMRAWPWKFPPPDCASPVGEIYPCGEIVKAAADLRLPVSFGSDGHCVNTIGAGFEELARHASAAGYTESLVFRRRRDGTRELRVLPF